MVSALAVGQVSGRAKKRCVVYAVLRVDNIRIEKKKEENCWEVFFKERQKIGPMNTKGTNLLFFDVAVSQNANQGENERKFEDFFTFLDEEQKAEVKFLFYSWPNFYRTDSTTIDGGA